MSLVSDGRTTHEKIVDGTRTLLRGNIMGSERLGLEGVEKDHGVMVSY